MTAGPKLVSILRQGSYLIASIHTALDDTEMIRFRNDLVDQMDLIIFPVVVGQGTRLFPDTGPDRALELVESRATSRGWSTTGSPRPWRTSSTRSPAATRRPWTFCARSTSATSGLLAWLRST